MATKPTALELNKMKLAYVKARKAYNAGSYLMSDEAYDELEKTLRKADPKWVELERTGEETKVLGRKEAVKLPVPMPSLQKLWADDTTKVAQWAQKVLAKSPSAELVGTPKLDGSSVEVSYTNGQLTFLATKGDGVTGKSIMHLAPQLKKLNTELINCSYDKVTFRVEAIMDNKVFTDKFAKDFDTSRAAVAGLLNRTTAHPAMAHIHFVVFSVLECSINGVTAKPILADQHRALDMAGKWGMRTAPCRVFNAESATPENFSAQVAKWRTALPYDQDGLALTTRGYYEPPTADKPKWSVAFKNNSQSESHVTVIEEVIWQPSKAGKLVPKARIKPVKFNGTTVTFCTLSNAKRCMERGWGPGAKVRVRRSGDIIPEIIETLQPAKFLPPPQRTFGEYKLAGVHYQLSNASSPEIRGKQLHAAATALGMEHLAVKSFVTYAENNAVTQAVFVRSLYRTPFRTSESLFDAGLSAVVVRKFMATKPVQPTLVDLMVATGLLGDSYGKRMVEKMLTTVTDVDWYNKDEVLSWLSQRGPRPSIAFNQALGPKRGADMLNGVKKFYEWLRRSDIKVACPTNKGKPKLVSEKLAGVCASWTSYRSKEEEALITANGGQVVPFGSKTTVLFYKDGGKASTKVDKAKAKGVAVSNNFQAWFKKQ